MKVLHITSSLDGGGIASLLMDYCPRMMPEIQFDFVVTSKEEGFLEKPLIKLGCNIYRVEQFRVNARKYFSQLTTIINEGNYDIVHNHADYRGFFGLLCAKKCKVKHRIAHSHLAYVDMTLYTKIEKAVFTPLVKKIATNLVACSHEAAVWTWGKNAKSVHIMKNAIDTKEYIFSQEKRSYIRNMLGIDNCFVVGNVARFTYQKNHQFLLEIFKKVLDINDNSVLLLIGDGELRSDIEKKVSEYKLENKVRLLGSRDDVPDLLNGMDCFVLPSRFEGLGIVYIEAQANGLHGFATEHVVPIEADIEGGLTFIDINASPVEWAKQITNFETIRRNNAQQKVISEGYDINIAADDMRRYYLSL